MGSKAERIITFLLQTLDTEASETVQAVLCVWVSKLLLCGFVNDERVCIYRRYLHHDAHYPKQVLTSLLMAYVSPVTADNQELRQCLSCFFPIYCYASSENQSRMRSVSIHAEILNTAH
jgi:condensin complex subunit 3